MRTFLLVQPHSTYWHVMQLSYASSNLYLSPYNSDDFSECFNFLLIGVIRAV